MQEKERIYLASIVNISSRFTQFIESQGISISSMEIKSGLPNGTLSRLAKNQTRIQVDNIAQMLSAFPNLNANWLLTGKGEMLNSANSETTERNHLYWQEVFTRFRAVCEKRKLDSQTLSKVIRSNEARTDSILTGRIIPTIVELADFARNENVNLNWLLAEIGEMDLTRNEALELHKRLDQVIEQMGQLRDDIREEMRQELSKHGHDLNRRMDRIEGKKAITKSKA